MNHSQGTVNFIASLLPLYNGEWVGGVWCARSLTDGTLILPLEVADDDDDAFVTVYWQGDSQRSSVVLGSFLASLAVAKYVQLRYMAEDSKDTRDEMAHLAQHFTFNTGGSLCFEAPLDPGLLTLVGKAVSKIGEVALAEVIKKAIGI